MLEKLNQIIKEVSTLKMRRLSEEEMKELKKLEKNADFFYLNNDEERFEKALMRWKGLVEELRA